MSRQVSYSKYEREIAAEFRDRLNHAESDEDVRKFFVAAAGQLFDKAFSGQVDPHYEDIVLTPGRAPYYELRGELARSALIADAFRHSDIDDILARLAEQASHHFRHEAGNPAKTNLKIFPGPDDARRH